MENNKNVLDRIFEETGIKYNSIKNINWKEISIHKNLSENFIREFRNDVNWYWISRYQKLSENFIREFQKEVDWEHISEYQKL